MRYRELYEMIDMGMIKSPPSFPITDNLKQFFIDQAVDKIGETVVLKKRTIELGSASSRRIVIPMLDMTTKVYKVECGKVNLPFIDEENTNPNIADGDISKNAWYVKQGNAEYEFSSGQATNVDNSIVTVLLAAPGGVFESPQSGTIIRIDDMLGASKAGVRHPFNGKEFKTTTFTGHIEALVFTADGNYSTTAGYSAFGTSGTCRDIGYYLNFLKIPEGEIKVYYYARPRRFKHINDYVDLPTELVSAVSHLVVARILSTDNQMQLGSGHRGLAKQIIEDWIQSRTKREQYPDIIPAPMTEFMNK